MRLIQFAAFLFFGILMNNCSGDKATIPDLSEVNNPDIWTVYNRSLIDSDVVQVNAKEGSGFVKLNDFVFESGTIELDIKGKNAPGQSFVGFAFHGVNDSTYDVVYFRPFNFQNPERNTHSVQYISHPKYTWSMLRENHPGVYENKLDIVPDPDGWFHVKIVVRDHQVEAFVENSETPSLSINQVTHAHEGWLGFWVGFNSEGWFRNLEIYPDDH